MPPVPLAFLRHLRIRRSLLSVPVALVLGAALPSPAVLAQPSPRIDRLSDASIERSGRLRIFGANFGAERGAGLILVDARSAFVTRWSDSEITAYVPEESALGPVGVEVVTAAGASGPASLDVAARRPSGRMRWRFRADAPYVAVRPAVALDGTVYFVDVGGNLYALRPDGGLLWIVAGAGSKGVDVAVDGTVYTGDEDKITAVNPDGSIRWVYEQNPEAFITLGPQVGPDGNVYAVSTEGLGVFSLAPDGRLRWNTPEPYRRLIVDYQELVFGPDPDGARYQMYFHANDRFARVDPTSGAVTPIFSGGRGQPAVGPDGFAYVGDNGGMASFAPDGTLRWSFLEFPLNAGSAPDVGPDGRLYYVRNLSFLTVLDTASGAKLSTYFDGSILDSPVVSPDNSVVALTGQPTYGEPGFMKGVSPSDGRLLWRVDLGRENGGFVLPDTRARFSPNGKAAYFGTSLPGGDPSNEYSYVYAIDPTPEGTGGEVVLSQGALTRAEITEFRVTGANPGETAYFFASRRGVGPGPCWPEFGELCLDLVAPVKAIGTAAADSAGTAILARRIPPRAALITVHTQAIVQRGPGGAGSVKTNTVSAPVLPLGRRDRSRPPHPSSAPNLRHADRHAEDREIGMVRGKREMSARRLRRGRVEAGGEFEHDPAGPGLRAFLHLEPDVRGADESRVPDLELRHPRVVDVDGDHGPDRPRIRRRASEDLFRVHANRRQLVDGEGEPLLGDPRMAERDHELAFLRSLDALRHVDDDLVAPSGLERPDLGPEVRIRGADLGDRKRIRVGHLDLQAFRPGLRAPFTRAEGNRRRRHLHRAPDVRVHVEPRRDAARARLDVDRLRHPSLKPRRVEPHPEASRGARLDGLPPSLHGRARASRRDASDRDRLGAGVPELEPARRHVSLDDLAQVQVPPGESETAAGLAKSVVRRRDRRRRRRPRRASSGGRVSGQPRGRARETEDRLPPRDADEDLISDHELRKARHREPGVVHGEKPFARSQRLLDPEVAVPAGRGFPRSSAHGGGGGLELAGEDLAGEPEVEVPVRPPDREHDAVDLLRFGRAESRRHDDSEAGRGLAGDPLERPVQLETVRTGPVREHEPRDRRRISDHGESVGIEHDLAVVESESPVAVRGRRE